MNQHHLGSPWQISVTDLAHRAGTSKHIELALSAPDDMNNPLIGIPEGSEIELSADLEAVHEGIFVTGTLTATAEGECSRCLDPLVYDLDVDLNEMFFFEEPAEPAKGQAASEDDDEIRLVDHDHIDLEPAARDAIVTALPFQPVCQDDCQGLCAQCGVRLVGNLGHTHEVLDPRWAALSSLAPEQEK